jgi:hypothetical protein
MESETGSGAVENVDENFLKASSEAKRLEKEAMPAGNKVFPSGAIFEQFDVEKISIDSYETALKDAEGIESMGVRAAKKAVKEEKAEKVAEPRVMSEKELERIPKEKVEVLTRSEQEIADEEAKLRSMKEKFAKLMSEVPNEQPVQIAPKMGQAPEAPRERQPILGTPKSEPERLAEPAVRVEEKPVADAAKAEEIKELSENFKRITMKKEEREKQERIRKMKKEIEDMLESG